MAVGPTGDSPGIAWTRAVLSPRLMCLFTVVVLLMPGCATLRVGSDYDQSAPFAAYRSFTWLPRTDYGTHNPLAVRWARSAIEAELERKGFQYTADPAAAQFAVDFTIGAKARVDIHSYPAPYGGPWYWYRRSWWGYPYWGAGVHVYHYSEGILAIDIFDERTHKPVWHGWARKPLTREDLEHSRAAIARAVDSVVAQFPPQ